MVYASGGRVFDDNLDPVFDAKGSVALDILERLVDLKNMGLLDQKSLRADRHR